MSLIRLVALTVLLSCLVMEQAQAQQTSREGDATNGKRVAMVVGIGAYAIASQRLPNPPNDAADMAAELRSLGFEVIEAIDVDLGELQRRLQAFGEALEDADAGLFFYAGHGMEYGGRNYLFPADAKLDRETDVRLRLIDVEDVLWAMETAVPTRIMILDACRDNPLALQLRERLPAQRARKVRQGLAQIDNAVGTFIAYSTAPGDVAADGTGRNSPFTEALLSEIDRPGLDADQLMQRVRNDVIEATDGAQVPWNVSSLRQPFILAGSDDADDATDRGGEDADSLVWQTIADSDDPDLFQAFLERFGSDSRYAEEAAKRLADLRALTTPVGDARRREVALTDMEGRIVLGCNKTGKTRGFRLGSPARPLKPVAGDIDVTDIELGGAENAAEMIAINGPELDLVLVRARSAGCGTDDRMTTDSRRGQWRNWRYLRESGGTRIDREYENWSGGWGSFRVESDLVTLAEVNERSACRAFVAFNSVGGRAFGGYACAKETPSIAQLTPMLDLLAWVEQ